MNVTVRFADGGIVIEHPGLEPRLWPYASLASAEPLTRHAIDALLSSSADPGASLFVADASFARDLPRHAPALSASETRWRHAKPWIAATAGLVALIASLWVLDVSPSHAIADLLPDRARTALGKEAIKEMTSGRRVCAAKLGRAALDRLTQRLTTGVPDTKFTIIVVDWSLMNAFAVPGEQIILTKGLIESADGPDEVAGVLAHEMGHAIERHPETGFVRAMGLSAAAQLLLGGNGGGTLANIGIMLAQLSYTRAAEHEADLIALDLLEKARISVQGFGRFFERVLGEEGGPQSKSALDILRTHPATRERKELVESRPAYPSTPSLTAAEWKALRTICKDETAPKGGEDI